MQNYEFLKVYQELTFKSTRCELDPCHENLFLIATSDHSLLINDLRDNQTKFKIPDAHSLEILDIDFNDNK